MAWSSFLTRLLVPIAIIAASAGPAYADSDSVYWGAHINGTPETPGLIDGLEADAGKHAAIVEWGEPWFHNGKYQSFQASYFEQVRERGSIPSLDWDSWDYCCKDDQPQFRLSTIVNGAHDGYLREWASAAAAWGHPFFLRFDAEMNGWWRPWNEQLNGNEPGEFRAAWRHVVDIFRQQGATNVTWVWCPNIVSPRSTPMSELYPGDDYVDWACLDGYNFGTDRGNAWQTFTEVFTGSWFNANYNSFQLLRETAPNKPIMIGETASSENGGSKADWITDMLANQLPHTFTNIGAFLWFDWNEGDPNLHWQLNSSRTAQSAFKSGIAPSFYLDNQFGSLGPDPIQSRRSLVVQPGGPPPADDTAQQVVMAAAGATQAADADPLPTEDSSDMNAPEGETAP